MELTMGMFMGLMFIVGLVLSIYALKIGPLVQNCDIKVQNAARGLLVVGVIMLSVAGTYMVCGCSASSITRGNIGMSFVVFMLLIGILVMSLTSIIYSGCPATRRDTPALITLSVLVSAVSAIYLAYRGYTDLRGGSAKSIAMSSRF